MPTAAMVIPFPQPSNSGKMPRKPRNKDLRSREYLTDKEVEALMKAARNTGRHGHRDATLILMAYRHGLRISELVVPTMGPGGPHPGTSTRRQAEERRGLDAPHQGARDTRSATTTARLPRYSIRVCHGARWALTDSTARNLVARAGREAGVPFPVHPHMLRHGCGFKLANDGHDTRALQHYLGHKNIQHTVRYTEMAPDRFNGFWKD